MGFVPGSFTNDLFMIGVYFLVLAMLFILQHDKKFDSIRGALNVTRTVQTAGFLNKLDGLASKVTE